MTQLRTYNLIDSTSKEDIRASYQEFLQAEAAKRKLQPQDIAEALPNGPSKVTGFERLVVRRAFGEWSRVHETKHKVHKMTISRIIGRSVGGQEKKAS